ncbi:hypothetical protein NY551_18410 [Curtobacterium flaccumfaciens pv. oortii]|uniref:hypothetical protein n=1 Tax=Curtobacterium flaccumfaciens TaxID=2035 RepID=UPI00265B1560|nr:hypothetical protein [Curtobacterium flaccumfaciens]MCS5524711.1 hypothetical protein [Curtobacterium flaccumfaciens pv. oortii]
MQVGADGVATPASEAAGPNDYAVLRADRVRIDIPEWLIGGQPDEVGPFAGWDLARADGGFVGRNRESVSGERPGLVKVTRLGLEADPSEVIGYQAAASRLGPYDVFSADLGVSARAARAQASLSARHPGNLPAALLGFRMRAMSVGTAAELPPVLAEMMEALTEEALPHAALYLIQTSPVLGNRYGVARAMLHPVTERPEHRPDGTTFASSMGLMNDVGYGLTAYLEPLVTSLSPYVWATTIARAGGVLIVTFGAALNASHGKATDLLALSQRDSAIGEFNDLAGVEQIAPVAFRAALRWWVQQLDVVFSQLTQPANYVVDGVYHPPAAVERMAAFEQICRSVQTIGSSRDEHARRLALFHALDSAQGVSSGLSRDRATTLNKMERLLERLRGHMPADVQQVLIPRAVAAVEALREVQDGFVMNSRIRPGGLLLPDAQGNDVVIPLATAAKDWLRVLRNSQHGLDDPSPRDRALLAAHNGAVSPRIADLAWLMLLEIMTFPELLERRPRKSKPRSRR